MTLRKKITVKFVFVVLFALFVGIIAYPQSVFFAPSLSQKLSDLRINLGLDLQGGLHVEYKMDLSQVAEEQKDDAKNAVQAVIERRVNAFGVGESLVQVAERGEDAFLIVALPGVANVEEAKTMLQETPFLEFRELRPEEELNTIIEQRNELARTAADEALARVQAGEDFAAVAREVSQDPGSQVLGGDLDFAPQGNFVPEFDAVVFDQAFADGAIHPELVETDFGWHIIKKLEERTGEGDTREVRAAHILLAKTALHELPGETLFVPTELTGRHLEGAAVSFGGGHQGAGLQEPEVVMTFSPEGRDLFAAITRRNVGRAVATYIDGELVTAPTVQTEITAGQASITGNFSIEEATDLAGRLNEGALPVPIELVSQRSIDASLGQESLRLGLTAGAIGLVLTVIYMIFYYRLFGVIAALALAIYTASMVAFFKLSLFLPEAMHITLSLAGIAGLILSIGMVVDANILIFERIREELRSGRSLLPAVHDGFARAWTSIHDGNLSTIITALILMWMGSGFVKGFALILILGVAVSMFTAIVLVRAIMLFIAGEWLEKRPWLIMGKKKSE